MSDISNFFQLRDSEIIHRLWWMMTYFSSEIYEEYEIYEIYEEYEGSQARAVRTRTADRTIGLRCFGVALGKGA